MTRICKECHRFSNEPNNQPHRALLIADLPRSGDLSCEFCDLLREIVRELGLNSPDKPSLYRSWTRHMLRYRNGRFEVERILFWVLPDSDQPCLWEKPAAIQDITFPTLSNPGTLGTALKWIEECTETHNYCDVAQDPTLPARVIDIGPDNDHVRLREGHGDRGRYICLSHCWGSHHPLQTTAASIRSHMSNIPWTIVPRTFQDAISVSRILNVRYIWIDSLCIVQDDKNDWAEQSSTMADVYSNSYLTIAATAAKNCTSGLFPDPENIQTRSLQCTTASGTTYYIRTRTQPPHSEGIHDYYQFPLLHRGWVLQERLLSPRMLHFGVAELYWECRRGTFCECGHAPVDKQDRIKTAKKIDPKTVDHDWRDIVDLFSRLQLTVPSDTLPALSGLAKAARTYMPTGKYLAGLWTNSLVSDLLWAPQNPSNSRRTATYRAPSWSWASMDGPVAFPHLSERGIIEIHFKYLDSHCTPRSSDETGELEDGWIKISAPIYHVSKERLAMNQFMTSYTRDEFPIEKTHCFHDFDLMDSCQQSSCCQQTAAIDHPMADLTPGANIYCARIATIETAQWVRNVTWSAMRTDYCLLLECVDQQARIFKRIGLLGDVRNNDPTYQKVKRPGDVQSEEKLLWDVYTTVFTYGGDYKEIKII